MQRVILPWPVIEGAAPGEAAARVIEAAPPLDGIRTSISSALDRAREMLGENGYSGLRATVRPDPSFRPPSRLAEIA